MLLFPSKETVMETIYDSKDILDILPHRHPFVLVDRIVECNDRDWIVGLKNVSASEPWFEGHFPGQPVFPGVLQLEAMAQTAGILLNKITKADGKVAYYLGVDKAKFRRIVKPGDQLRLELKLLRLRMGMARMAGRALVDGELACEAEMMFGGGGK
ncbi:MAG TPA: 3-hydroxyacyl-ACP dehydratase FabZ [Kiritimatiellia bacterium]|jgi:3-hydroxyacyl-[acyl-carrier-protein] dehydratase|nr:3-hydroxyacyl-ACP dehydratase FabZ [Kiritimatiellia bacterium]HQN79501.1 3-hydroxyacyl-ACP dehydratase FabZ [Kiritimatiellia bacterium]